MVPNRSSKNSGRFGSTISANRSSLTSVQSNAACRTASRDQRVPLRRHEPARSTPVVSTGRERFPHQHGQDTRQRQPHRSRWVIAHGRSDGQPVAAVVMGHPDNFGHRSTCGSIRQALLLLRPHGHRTFENTPGVPYISQYRFATMMAAQTRNWPIAYGKTMPNLPRCRSCEVERFRNCPATHLRR